MLDLSLISVGIASGAMSTLRRSPIPLYMARCGLTRMPVVASSFPSDFQKEIHPGLGIEPKAREFLVKEMEMFFFEERSESRRSLCRRLKSLQRSNVIRAADATRRPMSASE